jgi:hypothetical protein
LLQNLPGYLQSLDNAFHYLTDEFHPRFHKVSHVLLSSHSGTVEITIQRRQSLAGKRSLSIGSSGRTIVHGVRDDHGLFNASDSFAHFKLFSYL